MRETTTTDQFFEIVNSYQRTAALKAAVELGVFTAVADGADNVAAIAENCGASPRGTRILCDYLAVINLLTKKGERYRLTECAEMYLSRRSPWYLGDTVEFLASSALMKSFEDLATTVRRGASHQVVSVLSQDHPIWVQFARAMVPLAIRSAEAIAELVALGKGTANQILDVGAGHGMFGITIASGNPRAGIVAVDWPAVLTVATENALAAGLDQRYRAIPGDALSVDFGTGYDLALVTNFLHHFDRTTCIRLLEKTRDALVEGGRLAVLEFAPNDDRVSPPAAAALGITMLAATPAGEVYTSSELRDMLTAAGFIDVAVHPFPAPQTILLARK